jgi:hypothetical protein
MCYYFSKKIGILLGFVNSTRQMLISIYTSITDCLFFPSDTQFILSLLSSVLFLQIVRGAQAHKQHYDKVIIDFKNLYEQ